MAVNEVTSKIRKEYSDNLYSAEILAQRVLDEYYNDTPKFPIDIFKMLRDFGVFYKFSDLKKLEGIYLPEDKDGPAVVAINIKRAFQRQRFTGAHELAHHLKDYLSQVICPVNSQDPIEKYADSFASELLMPRQYFLEEANKLKSPDGYVTPEDAFHLCHFFGTSYQAVMWKLWYNRLLKSVPNKSVFKKAKAREKLAICYNDISLVSQIINSYTYFPVENTSYMWQKFINEFAFEDSRLEGVSVELSEVSEMLTDFRLFGESSSFYDTLTSNRNFEVLGHSLMYSYIYESDEIPARYEILHLHSLLFKHAPVEIDLGEFRKNDNRISGAIIETTPYHKIEEEIYLLVKDIEEILRSIKDTSIAEYLKRCVFIHHMLTKIHPFEDGNGRISRAIMNWLLKLKGLPPVYVSYTKKEDYYEALSAADKYDYSKLELYFMNKLLLSFVDLNSMFSSEQEH